MPKNKKISNEEDLDKEDYEVEEDEEYITVKYRDSSGKIQKRSIKKDKVRQKRKEAGGCFITSACIRAMNLPEDCIELTTFHKFRDEYLVKSQKGRTFIDIYYTASKDILENIINKEPNPEEILKNIYYRWIILITKEMQSQNYNLALSIGVSMVKELYEKYCS